MGEQYLIKEGLMLMVTGILIVFSFLIVMIYVMSLSRFFQRFSYLLPDPEPPAPKPATASADDGALVALAIAVAQRS